MRSLGRRRVQRIVSWPITSPVYKLWNRISTESYAQPARWLTWRRRSWRMGTCSSWALHSETMKPASGAKLYPCEVASREKYG